MGTLNPKTMLGAYRGFRVYRFRVYRVQGLGFGFFAKIGRGGGCPYLRIYLDISDTLWVVIADGGKTKEDQHLDGLGNKFGLGATKQ